MNVLVQRNGRGREAIERTRVKEAEEERWRKSERVVEKEREKVVDDRDR